MKTTTVPPPLRFGRTSARATASSRGPFAEDDVPSVDAPRSGLETAVPPDQPAAVPLVAVDPSAPALGEPEYVPDGVVGGGGDDGDVDEGGCGAGGSGLVGSGTGETGGGGGSRVGGGGGGGGGGSC